MSISFTRNKSSLSLSLIDILRADDKNYLTSSQYINEAKAAIHQEVATSPRIELLDDNNNMIAVAYGESWCKLYFQHEKGRVTLQLSRHIITNNSPTHNSTDSLEPTKKLRLLLERNPKTTASFFYAVGILDTLINHSMISKAQYNYWLALFKPD